MCCDHFLFPPLVREGFLPLGWVMGGPNTQHLNLWRCERYSVFVTYSDSAGKKHLACHGPLQGTTLGTWVSKPGLWEANLVVTRWWSDLSSHGKMSLASLNNPIGWQGGALIQWNWGLRRALTLTLPLSRSLSQNQSVHKGHVRA